MTLPRLLFPKHRPREFPGGKDRRQKREGSHRSRELGSGCSGAAGAIPPCGQIPSDDEDQGGVVYCMLVRNRSRFVTEVARTFGLFNLVSNMVLRTAKGAMPNGKSPESGDGSHLVHLVSGMEVGIFTQTERPMAASVPGLQFRKSTSTG